MSLKLSFPRKRESISTVRADIAPAATMGPRFRGGDGMAALETVGAWLLALIWILPLAYALWAAIHPSAYSAHFVLNAPLTLENFARAWNAAPFARYFLNTFLLVTMILATQISRSSWCCSSS
jgi:sn-glycerol 3-phosphate transport system permease protein